jgi:hypothetical protein
VAFLSDPDHWATQSEASARGCKPMAVALQSEDKAAPETCCEATVEG